MKRLLKRLRDFPTDLGVVALAEIIGVLSRSGVGLAGFPGGPLAKDTAGTRLRQSFPFLLRTPEELPSARSLGTDQLR